MKCLLTARVSLTQTIVKLFPKLEVVVVVLSSGSALGGGHDGKDMYGVRRMTFREWSCTLGLPKFTSLGGGLVCLAINLVIGKHRCTGYNDCCV
jgi:hypothetical protein